MTPPVAATVAFAAFSIGRDVYSCHFYLVVWVQIKISTGGRAFRGHRRLCYCGISSSLLSFSCLLFSLLATSLVAKIITTNLTRINRRAYPMGLLEFE